MGYAVLLTTLGFALAVSGLRIGSWGFLLLWLGLDFIVLGIAHLRGAHRVFGKRADGTLPLWSWILFFPLLAYTTVVWHLIRLLSRESRTNRISEQLVVGRRLLPGEMPDAFANYVDLTAEFQEPRALRRAAGYFAFPILDASAPDPSELRAAVDLLRAGPTFVHCAQGHGRTGLFALAVLLSSGAVRTVEEGLSVLASARPAICLSPEQTRCISVYARQYLSLPHSPSAAQDE